MRLVEITKDEFKNRLKDPFRASVSQVLEGNQIELELMGWFVKAPAFKDDRVELEFIYNDRLNGFTTNEGDALLEYLRNKFDYDVALLEYSPFVFKKPDANMHVVVFR